MMSPPENTGADLTPAGLQSRALLLRRRLIVTGLNAMTYLALLYWLASILSVSGWSVVDVLIFACFAIAAPWSVLGVWNALIGVWLLHGGANAREAVAPFAAAGDSSAPVTAKTAVLMTIRNEDPARAFARVAAVKAFVDATGQGEAFGWFVLSDTNDDKVAHAEEQAFAAWKARAGDAA